jgi:THH1/TOM1/TOM3 domain
MSFLSVCVAVGFFYFGIRLWLVLRHYRIISVRKRNQTRKVVGVAVITTLCFAARAGLIIWSVVLAFVEPNTRQWNISWEMVLFFFVGLETFPVALMLFLLRKLPNWKLDAERRGLIGAQAGVSPSYGYGTHDRNKARYSSYSAGLYSPSPRTVYSPVQ